MNNVTTNVFARGVEKLNISIDETLDLAEIVATAIIRRYNPDGSTSCLMGPNTVVSASAVIASSVIIGDRAIIGENAIVGEDVVIGKDVRIGDDVTIADKTFIGKNTQIEDGVQISKSRIRREVCRPSFDG